MPDPRAERVTLLEAAFRVANERMAHWPERHADGATANYFCECADRGCREKIALDRDAYEAVRRVPNRFVVYPGHIVADLEEKVDSGPGYEVVEKPDELIPLTEETDPRRPGGGPGRDAAEATAAEIEAGG